MQWGLGSAYTRLGAGCMNNKGSGSKATDNQSCTKGRIRSGSPANGCPCGTTRVFSAQSVSVAARSAPLAVAGKGNPGVPRALYGAVRRACAVETPGNTSAASQGPCTALRKASQRNVTPSSRFRCKGFGRGGQGSPGGGQGAGGRVWGRSSKAKFADGLDQPAGAQPVVRRLLFNVQANQEVGVVVESCAQPPFHARKLRGGIAVHSRGFCRVCALNSRGSHTQVEPPLLVA